MNLSEMKSVIQSEREQIANRIQELREQCDNDTEELKELKAKHTKAAFDSDVEALDSINDQIKKLATSIQERKEVIHALSEPNNPIIQRAVVEASRAWVEQIQQAEQQAVALPTTMACNRSQAGSTEFCIGDILKISTSNLSHRYCFYQHHST